MVTELLKFDVIDIVGLNKKGEKVQSKDDLLHLVDNLRFKLVLYMHKETEWCKDQECPIRKSYEAHVKKRKAD